MKIKLWIYILFLFLFNNINSVNAEEKIINIKEKTLENFNANIKSNVKYPAPPPKEVEDVDPNISSKPIDLPTPTSI